MNVDLHESLLEDFPHIFNTNIKDIRYSYMIHMTTSNTIKLHIHPNVFRQKYLDKYHIDTLLKYLNEYIKVTFVGDVHLFKLL